MVTVVGVVLERCGHSSGSGVGEVWSQGECAQLP